jgi:cytochrome c oxidase subunit 2
VKLVMTSQDVLHSFFIPNVRIKQDVVPGMYSSVWFEARVPGKHQVFCAEYCGTSHSGMLAQLIALDDQQWKDWNAGKKLGEIPVAGRETVAQNDAQNGVKTVTDQVQSAAAKPTLTQIPLAAQGKAVFEKKGCVSCHNNGEQTSGVRIGPSHAGLYGHLVELVDGSKVIADDNYIRESIENPQAKIVKGFNPVMPTYKGQVSETEMNALIAYIKSLK